MADFMNEDCNERPGLDSVGGVVADRAVEAVRMRHDRPSESSAVITGIDEFQVAVPNVVIHDHAHIEDGRQIFQSFFHGPRVALADLVQLNPHVQVIGCEHAVVRPARLAMGMGERGGAGT